MTEEGELISQAELDNTNIRTKIENQFEDFSEDQISKINNYINEKIKDIKDGKEKENKIREILKIVDNKKENWKTIETIINEVENELKEKESLNNWDTEIIKIKKMEWIGILTGSLEEKERKKFEENAENQINKINNALKNYFQNIDKVL